MNTRPEKEAALRPADIRMYRGVTSEPDLDYQTEASFSAERVDDEDEPIRVVVVDTVTPSDFTDWAPEQFTLNGESPVRVAGARNNRLALHVTNLGPDAAYLVRSAIGGSFTGAPIPVNGVVDLVTNRDVYATCLDAETALIGVVQEFVIDDDN